jgi:hypothetical protein
MAERRMISKKIIDTDAFVDMPISTRLLYYELNWRADDDGFVSSPKKITKMAGCTDDDLKLLILKNFIIPFESGIVLIRDWRIHNYIQKDRYHPTQYLDEYNQVTVEDNNTYTKCIQSASRLDTEVRLGKDRLESGKDRQDAALSCGSDFDQVDDKKKKPDPIANLSPAVAAAANEYIDARKKWRSPMTPRAIELLVMALKKLSSDENEQIAILHQSILHNWKDVYPLKRDGGGRQSVNPIYAIPERHSTFDEVFAKEIAEAQNGRI